MNTPLIETKKLKKYFETSGGTLHAVDGVDLVIPKGKTLGVVGESGCGKSTLGRVVLRLLDATAGEVLFNGVNILSLDRGEMKKIRPKMQMIFQDPYSSLDPRMTVSTLIMQPLRVNGVISSKEAMERRVQELMDTVGLARRYQNSYPHELDGGRRQRIGIARALALEPEFIVCDEPVSALDVSIQAQILNLLMDLQRDMGLTYLFITHNLSVVKHISDEIAVMYLGQCMERSETRELFNNPFHPYTQALLHSIPVAKLKERTGTRRVIQGELSSPINPVPGCRFRTRCPHATDECVGHDFELALVGENHFAACRLTKSKSAE